MKRIQKGGGDGDILAAFLIITVGAVIVILTYGLFYALPKRIQRHHHRKKLGMTRDEYDAAYPKRRSLRKTLTKVKDVAGQVAVGTPDQYNVYVRERRPAEGTHHHHYYK
jgi:hypothetical protein